MEYQGHSKDQMHSPNHSDRSTWLVLPLFAAACAVVTVILLLSSGLGSRVHLWHFRTGFALIKTAGYIGLGCALLALVSGLISIRKRHAKGILLSLLALLLALAAFGIPLYWKTQAQAYPRIHDISTDLQHPPAFVAISSARHAGVRYPGAAVAAMQQKAYPDLKTVVLPFPQVEAYKVALLAARDMGWDIVAELPAEGKIEATDTTKWFGFKDDIVIRIQPAGNRSLLDVRSVSREGISDVGTNAKRIRAYLSKVVPESVKP
ncbi:protein of unknown function DUF1499 [Citrifermentans bemidjiense Bem]|uniref:DUF1499 domain-containing protein n=1 Tax=Citrifermentans bemidjiense (strain ATCC BAA-1014 / DSM 16622 / JCM 12645 / Bem) TaxID=404380 RepID=B5ECQ0_CITBB|nr:DUF1499 domain-containing protein [Citrifermentans bemidjiense]ACH39085.1 protein of unknown function DUF1499 [Citrifermentans bemidjiense Bem]